MALMERRQAVLEGREVPDVWQTAPDRVAPLVAAAGEAAVREAERIVTLCLHRSRLVRSPGPGRRPARRRPSRGARRPRSADPLHDRPQSQLRADRRHHRRRRARRSSTTSASRTVASSSPKRRLKGPSSTWTYLVNDDPFRNQIGMMLTGPGKTTFAIGAALMSMPLLIFWGIVDRRVRQATGATVRSINDSHPPRASTGGIRTASEANLVFETEEREFRLISCASCEALGSGGCRTKRLTRQR